MTRADPATTSVRSSWSRSTGRRTGSSDWIGSDESGVGWGDGGAAVEQSRPAGSSRIKRKHTDELNDDDLAHMRKVVGSSIATWLREAPSKTRSTPSGAIHS